MWRAHQSQSVTLSRTDEALELLGIVSFLHRRIDAAVHPANEDFVDVTSAFVARTLEAMLGDRRRR